MARRFNLDVDMELALEAYEFANRFDTLFDMAPDFGASFNLNIAPQTLFSESYAAFALSDTIALLNDKEDSPVEAPQLPGQPLNNGPFGVVLELSSLLAVNGGDGSVGFVINGIDGFDGTAKSVSSAGDVNGDGFDDIIIGASNADPNNSLSGESYLVFGSDEGFAASLSLSALDGTNGFILNGIDFADFSGTSISSAGDFNGDGFDDIIIGAPSADSNGNNVAGESYIVFGSSLPFAASFELSSLFAANGGDGSAGFVINGISAGDHSGQSVSSAGDINGDGFDDIILGAPYADANGANSGQSYVIYGSNTGIAASFELSFLLASNGGDGTNGFVINGIDANDDSGAWVSSAGDINGDGFEDIIIGASYADPDNKEDAGESYVIFGSGVGFGATIELSALNGVNGFVINGIDVEDQSGLAVSSAGDINADGFDDIIIGSGQGDANGNSGAGESYIIFGSNAGFGASLDLFALDGTNGFLINGIDNADFSGFSVASAGDVNGDGFDDILIGAFAADPNSTSGAGETYVIFGADAGFAASFDLSSLNGINGFSLNGFSTFQLSGQSVSSAGDINGDGFDDILIGAPRLNSSIPGDAFVIYGRDSFFEPVSTDFELSSLLLANGGDGSAGFIINGVDGTDSSGRSVSSAGDVNGDGYDDILIGARFGDPNGSNSGESYVVFGTNAGVNASLDLSSLDGANGFVINGIDRDDESGRSVSSAGDINGDGFDDILIGANRADPNGSDSGESYVVFGQAGGFSASLDLSSLDGTNGFVINGIDVGDYSGASVSSAGDINDDGFDDILIGAIFADPNGNSNAGESYLVFGSNVPFSASLELSTLDGTNGFVINGIDANDLSGISVSSAGDINGDGFDDILIGAQSADPNGNSGAGETYVVFGSNVSFSSSFELSMLDGTNGFVINGIDASDLSGVSVSSAGDFNGDGFDDILIGAQNADPNGSRSGESYLVFGSDVGFGSSLELSSLNGANGFVINGVEADDFSGRSVSSAGDINGDGFDDILIGADSANPNGDQSGESYVIFGQAGGFAASLDLLALDGTNGFVINGIDPHDFSGHSVSSAGDVNGDGFDDILIGATSADPNSNYGAGETYVIYGQAEFGRITEILTASDDVYTASDTGEVVYGLAGNDVINGGIASDVLFGDEGDDTLNGNAGNDRVEGGAGNDILNGGDGQDIAVYNGSLTAYSFLNNGDGTFTISGNGEGVDILSNIELASFSDGDISLSPSSLPVFTEGDDVVDGTSGGDVLDALGGNDIVNGLGRNDTIFGRAGDDTLNGGGGNDIISGGEGNDVINGGDDNDIALFSNNQVDYTLTDNGDGTATITDNVGFDGTDTLVNIETLRFADGDVELYTAPVFTEGDDVSDGSENDDILDALGGNDIVNGLGGNDTIFGRAGNDMLFGGLGNDMLIGGLGADIIDGGDGDDIIVAGPSDLEDGIDTVNGGAGNDTITGGFFIDILNGDAGDDRFVYLGADFIDTLNGGDDNDTLDFSGYSADNGNGIELYDWIVNFTAGIYQRTATIDGGFNGIQSIINIENIEAGIGNDTLTGDNSVNVINGGGGNDRIDGGAGADILDGGDGTDTLSYASSTSGVTVNLSTTTASGGDAAGDVFVNFENLLGSHSNDILTGDSDNNLLDGNIGNDRLDGGAGEDHLIGGDGADTLLGGAGADVMDGGLGFDSADYRGATEAVRFNVVTGGTVGEAAGDTFSGIERYYLSNFNDIITGSSANEFFYGEDGNDQINGGGGIDRIYGGDGNDIQRGQDGNDTLYGSAGNDQLNGGAGFDIANYTLAAAGVTVNMLFGGSGGDADGDTYFGIEAVYGSDFDDSLTGNNSVNELRGGDGDDMFFGLGGNDRFFGSEGSDSFDGGTGTDIVNYTLATAGVTLDLTSGGTAGEANGDSFTSVEWVFGSNFDDSITGDVANNRLEGRDGNDTLNGEGGNDRLLGGDGNDIINGGDGVDTIFGQDGDDILSGGADNDFFFGGAGADSHDGGSGTDTVSYLGSSGPIFIINGAGVTDDAAGDTYTDIERYFGSSLDDYIHAAGVLLGNGGQDYLEGMNGSNDSLNGGAGLDSFGYDATAGGADVITGFFLNEQIEILGGDPNFDTQAEVLAVGTDVGANVIFDFGGGNTLTIVGHNLADLPSGTFTFAGAAEPLNDPDAFAADIVDVFDMDALI